MSADFTTLTLRPNPLVAYLGAISFLSLGSFFVWLFAFSGNVNDAPPLVRWSVASGFLLVSLALAVWIYMNGKSWVRLSGTHLEGKIGFSRMAVPINQVERITFFPKMVSSGGDIFSVLVDSISEGISPTGRMEIKTEIGKWNMMQIFASEFLKFIDSLEKTLGKPLKKEEHHSKIKKIEFILP